MPELTDKEERWIARLERCFEARPAGVFVWLNWDACRLTIVAEEYTTPRKRWASRLRRCLNEKPPELYVWLMSDLGSLGIGKGNVRVVHGDAFTPYGYISASTDNSQEVMVATIDLIEHASEERLASYDYEIDDIEMEPYYARPEQTEHVCRV